jgi:glycosyltransferase involved in cell wall biosynthesis
MHTHRVSIVIPVYRNSARAVELVMNLRSQRLPPGASFEIIVVDDGSNDDSFERMEVVLRGHALLYGLRTNSGRSVARNAGAAKASGDVLFFMDSDCLPADDTLIAAHLAGWGHDVAASIGPVTGKGYGFWHDYQVAASKRRERQHAAGLCFSGSSQNLMVSRVAFETCGGFDDAFRTYGFEDRDVQIRVARFGRIVWAAAAGVKHMDDLTLPLVSRKMSEAGGRAALVFSQRHPAAYRALGYSALDTRLHRWQVIPAKLLQSVLEPIARIGEKIVANAIIPYPMKSLVVKVVTGISFLVGTIRTRQPVR